MSSPPEKKQISEEYVALLEENAKQLRKMLDQEKQQRFAAEKKLEQQRIAAEEMLVEENAKQLRKMLDQEKQQRFAAEKKLEQEKQQRIADGIAAEEMLEQQRIAAKEIRSWPKMIDLVTKDVQSYGTESKTQTCDNISVEDEILLLRKFDWTGLSTGVLTERKFEPASALTEPLTSNYASESDLSHTVFRPFLLTACDALFDMTGVRIVATFEKRAGVFVPDATLVRDGHVVGFCELKLPGQGRQVLDLKKFAPQAGKYINELFSWGVRPPMCLVTTVSKSLLFAAAEEGLPELLEPVRPASVPTENRTASRPETSPEPSQQFRALAFANADCTVEITSKTEDGVGTLRAYRPSDEGHFFVVLLDFLWALAHVKSAVPDHPDLTSGGVKFCHSLGQTGQVSPKTVQVTVQGEGQGTSFFRHVSEVESYATVPLFLWNVLDSGVMGEALVATDKDGHLFILKRYRDTNDVAETEAEHWKKINGIQAVVRPIDGTTALLMPFVSPFQREDRAGAIDRTDLRDALEAMAKSGNVFRESDISWRHVGLIGDGKIKLIDFGSLVGLSGTVEEWVDKALDILRKRM